MKEYSTLLALALLLVLSVDIISEIICQRAVPHRFSLYSKPSAAVKFIESLNMHDLMEIIHKSVHHRIMHLFTHLFLSQTSLLFLLYIMNKNIIGFSLNLFKDFSFLIVRRFMGLSSFEMLLLQLEHAIFIFFECMACFSHFFDDSTLSLLVWSCLVVFVITPIHVRAKVFLEKRLHWKAPLVMAAIYSLVLYLYPYIFFMVDLKMLHHLEKIDMRFESVNTLCSNYGTSFSLYHDPSPHYSESYKIINFFGTKSIIVHCNFAKIDPKRIEPLLFHACQSFKMSGLFANTFLPVFQRFLAAFVMIVFDKYMLVRLCGKSIDHVTAHLVVEEAFANNLERYVFVVLNLIHHYVEHRADIAVQKEGLGVQLAEFLVLSELPAGCTPIISHSIYKFFNHGSDLFGRIGILINHSK